MCYTREVLGQTGAGHFSPIGGVKSAGVRLQGAIELKAEKKIMVMVIKINLYMFVGQVV